MGGCAIARTYGNQTKSLARHEVRKHLGGPAMPLTLRMNYGDAAVLAFSEGYGIAAVTFVMFGLPCTTNMDLQI